MSKHDSDESDANAAIPIGLDDGFAATKVALPDGRLVVIPSRGCIGASGITWLDGQVAHCADYTVDGVHYAVGMVAGQSTQFDDYPTSGLNRAIVQHALQTAGLAGRTLHVVSGLPVSAYYHPDGRKRAEAIAAKVASLKQAVDCGARRPAEIAFHAVIPEALAAWYDFVIDDSSGEASLDQVRAEQCVAIVDIGGRTTDYVLVQDQGLVHLASGSVRAGLLDVRAQIAAALQAQTDLQQLDERVTARALETGQVRLFGRDLDVRAMVTEAKTALIATLHAETQRKLGRASTVDQVRFVGGGSVVLADVIRDWYPHGHIAPHPTFANARGMLQYLRYVCGDVPDHRS